MSVLDGPGEGTWSVFAQKVVEERDAAREEAARLRQSYRDARDTVALREKDIHRITARAKQAEQERDAIGIQLVAAQERLRLAGVCVGVLRGALIGGGFTEHARNVAREALDALDTVPGDAKEPA